jgi:hypothetical protein
MAAHKSITRRLGQVPNRVTASLRKLAAGLGIALVLAMHAGAAPSAGAVAASRNARFVDHGGPVLHAAQVYLLYWGRDWTDTSSYSPTPGQITIAVQTLVAGPYLTGLAQYRAIRPAVLRGASVVTTSQPHSGFTDDDVSDFLDAQLDAGVVPGPGLDDQTLYIVVVPLNISAARDGSELIGEHSYYKRHGQRIRFAWTADSGNLTDATRAISHELVESATDPDGNAVRGVSATCRQSGWCEIADICSDIGVTDGIAVSPYWSDRAHACVAPDQARTKPSPPACTPHACESQPPQPRCAAHRREADPECR